MTVVSKLIKRIVFKQLYEYLNNNNLFPSRFRPMFSTETALLEVSNEWLWNIDNNFLKGVTFLSLKNAFDVIDYIIMQGKLSLYGVSSHSVNWFQSYLSEEKQTSYNGVLYESCDVTCGIPWGPILGPFLFTVYINDLPVCNLS